jgi:HlyD family secretion protein
MGYESLSDIEEPVKDNPDLEDISDEREDAVIGRGDAPVIAPPAVPQDDDLDEEPNVAKMSLFSPRSLSTMAIGLVIGVAITIGGMGFAGRGSDPVTDENLSAADTTSTELPDASQTVTVATAKSSRISRTLEATGTVQAYDLLPILPQSPGLQIQQVLVDEGDYVTAGQVMAILDDSVVRSQVADAQAQVESVRSSKIQTEAGVWQAQAALDQAKVGQTEAEAAISQARAAQSEAEAGLQQAIAAKSEVEASVPAARAAKLEAEAGRDQAVASLGQAEAELAQAERELERYQELADAGAISRQELEIRRTTVEMPEKRCESPRQILEVPMPGFKAPWLI